MQQETEIQKFPPIWIFNILKSFRIFLNRFNSRLVPSSVAIYEKAQLFWISKTIGVACELGLSDILSSGPKHVSEIANECEADEESLYRLMRALASEGIYKESKERVFENTTLSAALQEGKGSVKYMIQHQMNETNWKIVGQLGQGVKTGKCVSKEILGMDIFEHLAQDKEKNELYNKAMTNTSAMASATFLAAYDFSGLKRIVDIGGGEGYLLSIILQKYKNMEGVVLDFPHVVKTAVNTFKKFNLGNRAEAREGDFNKDIPQGFDAYIMKNILHAYDDDTCISILKILYQVMPEKGKVLIMEAVIGLDNKPEYGKFFDLQMMIGTTKGGKERTEKEFRYILEKAGFEFKKVIQTVSPFSIVEVVKN